MTPLIVAPPSRPRIQTQSERRTCRTACAPDRYYVRGDYAIPLKGVMRNPAVRARPKTTRITCADWFSAATCTPRDYAMVSFSSSSKRTENPSKTQIYSCSNRIVVLIDFCRGSRTNVDHPKTSRKTARTFCFQSYFISAADSFGQTSTMIRLSSRFFENYTKPSDDSVWRRRDARNSIPPPPQDECSTFGFSFDPFVRSCFRLD